MVWLESIQAIKIFIYLKIYKKKLRLVLKVFLGQYRKVKLNMALAYVLLLKKCTLKKLISFHVCLFDLTESDIYKIIKIFKKLGIFLNSTVPVKKLKKKIFENKKNIDSFE